MEPQQPPPPRAKRNYPLAAFLGFLGGLIVILWSPLHSRGLSAAALGCAGLAWLALLRLTRRPGAGKWPGRLLLGATAAVTLLFSLPARKLDSQELADAYVARLKAYEGAEYLWGGENARGIDCSGLPRRSLRGALFSYGLRHLDGGALRQAALHFWHDASAKALAGGYRGYVRPLGISGTVRTVDTAQLRPGDLAITTSGVHVIVYAGDGQWIQAAPAEGRVLTLDGKTGKNGWFDNPVELYRWAALEDGAPQAGENL
jgi:hypothetical protein